MLFRNWVDVDPSDTDSGETGCAGGGRDRDDMEDGRVDGVLALVAAEVCPVLVSLLLETDLVLVFVFVFVSEGVIPDKIRSRRSSKSREGR